jgi:pimeloyl-ACP methyl ester carboxylesterase
MRVRKLLPLLLLCTFVGGLATVAAERRPYLQAAATATAPLAASPDQTVTVEGATLRYKDIGTGVPVVLIHGYTANLESMLAVGAPLASTSRIVAFDVRGFGKSSKFAEPSRYGQAMVDDVMRLLDHLKIERAHLVGHSMGALIAANVAARYPDRVSSATLIAGPFYADKPTFAKEVKPWVSDLESGKGLNNFMLWLFPKVDPKLASGFSMQAVKNNDLPSLIAVMRSLPELAIRGLERANVPALVAVGTGDPLHPLSTSFAKASKAATYLEVAGADHVSIASNRELQQSMRQLIK